MLCVYNNNAQQYTNKDAIICQSLVGLSFEKNFLVSYRAVELTGEIILSHEHLFVNCVGEIF